MLSSAAAVVGGLFIGTQSTGAGADHSSRTGVWCGSLVLELLSVVPFLCAIPSLFHEIANSNLLHAKAAGAMDIPLGLSELLPMVAILPFMLYQLAGFGTLHFVVPKPVELGDQHRHPGADHRELRRQSPGFVPRREGAHRSARDRDGARGAPGRAQAAQDAGRLRRARSAEASEVATPRSSHACAEVCRSSLCLRCWRRRLEPPMPPHPRAAFRPHARKSRSGSARRSRTSSARSGCAPTAIPSRCGSSTMPALTLFDRGVRLRLRITGEARGAHGQGGEPGLRAARSQDGAARRRQVRNRRARRDAWRAPCRCRAASPIKEMDDLVAGRVAAGGPVERGAGRLSARRRRVWPLPPQIRPLGPNRVARPTSRRTSPTTSTCRSFPPASCTWRSRTRCRWRMRSARRLRSTRCWRAPAWPLAPTNRRRP